LAASTEWRLVADATGGAGGQSFHLFAAGDSPMPLLLQKINALVNTVRDLLQSSRPTRSSAEAIAKLEAETSGLPLTQLDGVEQMIRQELRYEGHASSRPGMSMPELARPLTWLDLCSGNGYTRERALRCLSSAAPNALFLALALRRLNDWVPQVRQAAREQLPTIAAASAPAHVAEALWSLLPHALSWGRMEPADQATLAALISIEPVALVLKNRIRDAAAGPASTILAQVGRTPALDGWLGEIARDAVQPSVRARAYRSLFEARTVWVTGRRWAWIDQYWGKRKLEAVVGERAIPVEAPFLDTLKQALNDRSPIVRKVGAEFLIKRLDSVGEDAPRMAAALAADPSRYVAERGRFALGRLGQ